MLNLHITNFFLGGGANGLSKNDPATYFVCLESLLVCYYIFVRLICPKFIFQRVLHQPLIMDVDIKISLALVKCAEDLKCNLMNL